MCVESSLVLKQFVLVAELAELGASVPLGAVQRADLRPQLLLQLATRLQIRLQLLNVLLQTARTITSCFTHKLNMLRIVKCCSGEPVACDRLKE